MKITPVILSGGSGTRLWPLSRKMYPKQFLNLHAELTMLQETLGRLDGLELNSPIIFDTYINNFFFVLFTPKEPSESIPLTAKILLISFLLAMNKGINEKFKEYRLLQ